MTAKYDNNSFHILYFIAQLSISNVKYKIRFLHVCASHHDKTKIHMTAIVVDM